MFELALVETVRESMAVAWSHLQWWASVSFGLIALAGFGRDKLNRSSVIGLTILYSAFSVYSLVNTTAMVVHAEGARDVLRTLAETEGISSAGSSAIYFSETWGWVNLPIFAFCYVATFAGSLAYLWHSYRTQTN